MWLKGLIAGVFSIFIFTTNSIAQEITEEVTNEITYPYYVKITDERDNNTFNIKIEDPAVIQERLSSIQNVMPMVYNESVEFWLHFFMQRRPNFTKAAMEKSGLYFPMFERILKEHDMPDELKYLAILESGLNPKAISRSKAVGLWQFMSFTGKEYGLVVNNHVDERMQPEKSTEAAARYLKYLNSRFNDWDLALASYNTGPGRISRAMRKSGRNNYWDIHPYIHKDTRAYVPQFIALAYLMNFGEDHGIIPDEIQSLPELETIFVNGDVDLEILADLSKSNIEELMLHNPHLLARVLPKNDFGYEIAIPAQHIDFFYENRVAILDSASFRFKNNLELSSPAELLAQETVESGKTETDTDEYVTVVRQVKKVHRVKRGEILNRIATQHNVSVAQIKRWNNKKDNKIIVGERLTIFVNQKDRVKATSMAAKTTAENVNQTTYYTVQKGDTLWNISQKYEGVTVNDLKKWNNLTNNNVKVGQKIKINS